MKEILLVFVLIFSKNYGSTILLKSQRIDLLDDSKYFVSYQNISTIESYIMCPERINNYGYLFYICKISCGYLSSVDDKTIYTAQGVRFPLTKSKLGEIRNINLKNDILTFKSQNAQLLYQFHLVFNDPSVSCDDIKVDGDEITCKLKSCHFIKGYLTFYLKYEKCFNKKYESGTFFAEIGTEKDNTTKSNNDSLDFVKLEKQKVNTTKSNNDSLGLKISTGVLASIVLILVIVLIVILRKTNGNTKSKNLAIFEETKSNENTKLHEETKRLKSSTSESTELGEEKDNATKSNNICL